MGQESHKFQFAIDRGGTFTDVFARCPNGEVKVMKLLSVDPKNYPDAPVRVLRINYANSLINVFPFLD